MSGGLTVVVDCDERLISTEDVETYACVYLACNMRTLFWSGALE